VTAYTDNAVGKVITSVFGKVFGSLLGRVNGNIESQRITIAGLTLTQSYEYDEVNWLRSAHEANGQTASWRQTPTENVWQVYGIDSELLAEYAAGAAPSAPQTEYGYRNGELLVTAEAAPLTNVALNKTATQSSTFDPSVPAGRAVDGNTSGTHASGTISHTNLDAQAWWQVDLGSVQSINRIKVWNHADCCTSTTSAFYVLMSDVPFASCVRM
jgi:hypothetical protein